MADGRMWASAPTNKCATECVGVDALIDPTAKRPDGQRADVGIRPYNSHQRLTTFVSAKPMRW